MKCYECKFRSEVMGSAHSSCRVISQTKSDNYFELELLLATHQVNMTSDGEDLVKLNPHGVKNGWANWPLNFDPVWVDECKFYTKK